MMDNIMNTRSYSVTRIRDLEAMPISKLVNLLSLGELKKIHPKKKSLKSTLYYIPGHVFINVIYNFG